MTPFSIAGIQDKFYPWLIVILGTCAVALALYLVRRFIIARLVHITGKTSYTIDSVLVKAIGLPLTLLVIVAVLVSCHWLVRSVGLISNEAVGSSWTIIQFLCLFALLTFVDRLIHGLIIGYSERSATVKTSRSIIQVLCRVVIILLGLLMLLSTMGISITPIMASLGITSLAVALALQPTLENVFSGVQLIVDKPIRVGDFIELESGEQGFVDKIGWRSTWIRMLQNNTIIMPNSEMAKSKIINYFYPEKELSVPVDVSVHYSSDLEQVERVSLEVARDVLVTHKWGVDDYETFVVFTAFDSSSINFTVMLRAKEYFNRFWVKSAFIKALHKRYAEEGIVIPFPITAINTAQESAVIRSSQ